MKSNLRILVVEDSVEDTALLERTLRRGGLSFSARRVETRADFVEQLEEFAPDLVISDYNLPSFDGLQALELVRGKAAWLPFILVSGHIGEERAAESLKLGATDFILKDRLGRLVPCIQRALHDVEERTKLKRLEERFRLFVEAAPNAMVMIGADGRIEMVNGQTERMFGHARAELLGEPVEMLIPERQRARHQDLRSAFFATNQPRPMGNGHHMIGQRCDGSEFPAEIGLNPIETEAGAVVLCVIVDITARRQQEQEQERQRQELERSNADLEEFAYVASHDLKAPLRAIAHLAQWIREDIEPAARRETTENLDLLQGRVARLRTLLDGLLSYSRIGRVDSDVELVDIGEEVRDIVAMSAPPPGFAVVWDTDMPVLRTHRVAIRVVLENLIVNALKHHDRGEGRVAVAMRLADGMAEFRVSDDGPGIPERFHDRIFVIFQTLASRDEVESSGIGLAIVKRRIEGHGGRIRVESAPPARGTTFVFTWKQAEA
jgi:PAS domain S-box-containing protein